jgi:chromosome partitioning protein
MTEGTTLNNMTNLSLKKVSQLFECSEEVILSKLAEINPESAKANSKIKNLSNEQICYIGSQIGFLKKPDPCLVLSVFTTKGGVLKTTLTLNLARIAALNGIRTCVVGLDIQSDITRAIGHDADLDNETDIQKIIKRLNQTKGLADYFKRSIRLESLIHPTNLPTLFYIPETPELAALNESLNNINRREYWLREKVIEPLKEKFDLILMDCSPNWNRLITNALVSSDALLSPLECKINNFRNFKVFGHFLQEFKKEMNLDFNCFYIPTLFSQTKKLGRDIFNWYQTNVEGATEWGIRESVVGEESNALKLSLLEHSPQAVPSQEIRNLLKEIWPKLLSSQGKKILKNQTLATSPHISSQNFS